MSINGYKYCLRETGTGLKITNRSAQGVSAATGSMTTVLACNLGDARSDWSAPAPIEGLGAQDKVPDRPEEIRAVSLTVYRLERQGASTRCD
ncbi:MAG: hypothetical protein ACREXR_19730 [Gammaproteobacteria bacterium]